ncbi:unnamed protein product [Durusdinium trenchii]
MPDSVSCGAAISACEKGTQWHQALHLLSRWKKLPVPFERSRSPFPLHVSQPNERRDQTSCNFECFQDDLLRV